MKIEKKSLVIGAAGGLIASLCCLTPLAIFFFGLGGLSFALSFSKYKPLFLILGVLFVVSAVYLYYFRKNACTLDPRIIKQRKYLLVTIIIFMFLVYFFLTAYVAPGLAKRVFK
ncbi:hypothetical protein HZB00_00335 [Candidatus Woesearchaeota archaeon]|nr:hypothetical protein [Candidatus Woesearchaeota archaeon]